MQYDSRHGSRESKNPDDAGESGDGNGDDDSIL